MPEPSEILAYLETVRLDALIAQLPVAERAGHDPIPFKLRLPFRRQSPAYLTSPGCMAPSFGAKPRAELFLDRLVYLRRIVT